MHETIVSAAFYAAPDESGRVSLDWVEAVVAFLDSKIPIKECSFHGAAGENEGPGPFPRLRDRLRDLSTSGSLREVTLYSHRERDAGLLLSWQGCAFAEFPSGVVFLGLPAGAGVSPGELVRFLYASSKGMSNWVYGIGYLHPSDRGPAQYATGMLAHSGPIIPRSTRPEDSREHMDRVMRWLDEMRGGRRHLHGWFRDVYPVSLLSEAHVQAPLGDDTRLIDSGLGTFAQLGERVWLWEVPQETIPRARQALIDARLLICAETPPTGGSCDEMRGEGQGVAKFVFSPRNGHLLPEEFRDPDLDTLARIILNPEGPGWEFEEAEINYFEGARRVRLFVERNPELGYYLYYVGPGGMDDHEDQWFSLSDQARLGEIVCTCDWRVPAGLFVVPQLAWEAIREFCTSGERSPAIDWIKILDVPEDGGW